MVSEKAYQKPLLQDYYKLAFKRYWKIYANYTFKLNY